MNRAFHSIICILSYLSRFSEKPVAQLERVMNQLLRCNSSSSTASGPGDSAEKDTLRAPDAPHVLVLDELETLCPASIRRADRTSAGDPDALRTISLLERLFACIERHPSCRLLVIGILSVHLLRDSILFSAQF